MGDDDPCLDLGTVRRGYINTRRFLFAVVLVAASAPLSAFGQKSEEPQDCLHHALDDETLKVVSLDDFNKSLEARQKQLTAGAPITSWIRLQPHSDAYLCPQHPDSIVDNLEKRSVQRLAGGITVLSMNAKAGLRGVCLRKFDLRGLDLAGADLTGANLYKADLTGADLQHANLRSAILECAKLTAAFLDDANLTGASLKRTLLTNASLTDAILTDALFEPREAVPDADRITDMVGLSSLHFKSDKSGLENLRKALREGGRYHDDEEVRYSIIMSELEDANWFEWAFSYVFFGLTNSWGLTPWRPIVIFLVLIPIFCLVYLFFMWRKWGTIARILPNHPDPDPDKELPRDVDVRTWPRWQRYPTVFYFSVLSAFHLKLADLDPGAMIAGMQPRIYRLRAIRWLRLASGVQSLMSLYLLALWAFTYVSIELHRIFE